jgi:hypothetical protein
VTRRTLLVLALLLACFDFASAAADELGANQVLIDATLVSVSRHVSMEFGLIGFEPNERIDASTEAAIATDLAIAKAQTQSVIDAIVADVALASSPVGVRTLGHLDLARAEQLEAEELLDDEGFPKSKTLRLLIVLGASFQNAAVVTLQGRPERFSEGKRAAAEAAEYTWAFNQMLPFLVNHGLSGLAALYEPFSGGKGNALAEGIGLVTGPDAQFRVRKGQVEISTRLKEASTAGVDLGIDLPEDFTVLVSYTLPQKGSDKPRDELEGFSAGVKLTSDRSANPAEAFFIEHQTSPQGFVQSFTASKTAVIDVFPHVAPSLGRQITSFLVKDGDTLVMGGLLKDGANETLIQSEDIPVVGDLPVLGFFFRNGTRKTPIQADNLLIYVTPFVIQED